MCFDPKGKPRSADTPEEPRAVYLDSMLTPDGEYQMNSFYSQDKMAWETQGAIADRSRENLGSSDEGIILYRKLLRDQIEIVQNGGEPIALMRDPEKNRVIRFESTKPILQ